MANGLAVGIGAAGVLEANSLVRVVFKISGESMSEPSLDIKRDVVEFRVDRVRCAISLEALEDHFAEHLSLDHLDCFKSNHREIERKAQVFIKEKRFEPDGSILIRSKDF